MTDPISWLQYKPITETLYRKKRHFSYVFQREQIDTSLSSNANHVKDFLHAKTDAYGQKYNDIKICKQINQNNFLVRSARDGTFIMFGVCPEKPLVSLNPFKLWRNEGKILASCICDGGKEFDDAIEMAWEMEQRGVLIQC